MTSREIIQRVLAFDDPPRIGFRFSAYNGEPRLNDFCGGSPTADPSWEPRRWQDETGEYWTDEWGNVWRRVDPRHSGEVHEGAIRAWDDLDGYRPPTLDDRSRYERARESFAANPDKYRLGSIPGCSFNVARKLRRLDNYLLDCAAEPELVRRLNGTVLDLILKMVDIYADIGADGVFFCEDWGTQDQLLISPAMWRDLFLPDFERLVSHAHARGLTVWMHSCGYVYDIIEPLAQAGMDVLQFDQPELHGIDRLAHNFAGRMTFWCPVDIQKILPTGDRELIQARACYMRERLGGSGGGFIAKNYGSVDALGCSPEWEHWAYKAFVEVGEY